MDLDVRLDRGDDGAAVIATGSIDISSRALLASAAEQLLNDHPATLVLDLSGVTFIDSTGIGTLVTLAAGAAERGSGFLLRNPSRPVSRILEVAGLADQWLGQDGSAA